ncbi:trypsin [Blastococcus colisei]|uniref:Trypsin n=1 Tax=Blastococcus colisei TaxID=1564162 RepID=A0A543P9L5_9ACTN|nr:trypsin-like serine protease [Blastococcus colisei]TQN40769.1 trypsin [Blastococcus colisei]
MRLPRVLAAVISASSAVLAVGALGMAPAAAIANGVAAEEGQFPFAVQLKLDDIMRSDGTTYDSACSGALISPTWIMTAGHCFHDGDRNRVSGAPRYATTARLGTASTTDPDAGVTRTVTWVEQSSTNDIAVARLDAPVEGITPIALNTAKPARGQVLTFAGWGATTSDGPPSEQLYWGQVSVSSVRSTTVLVKGHWPAKDTSACPYDSGAPYFTDSPTPALVSVESGGPACPHRQQETTARVDVVLPWVNSVVTDLS